VTGVRVHVEIDPPTLARHVWLFSRDSAGTIVYRYRLEDGVLVRAWDESERVDEAAPTRTPPSLVVPADLWELLESVIAPDEPTDQDALGDTRRVRDRLLTLVETLAGGQR
jgi:hypothetical protein